MRLFPAQRTHAGPSPKLGLLLLSVLWAAASLRSDLLLNAATGPLNATQTQALLFSLFAVLATSIAWARRRKFPGGRHFWSSFGIGVALFVVPAALIACAQGSISRLDQVAVFSLTPVFAIVLEPHLQGAVPRPPKAGLAGALAAVAGTLCIFPLDLPGSARAGAALCALFAAAFCIAAANCLAVRLAHKADGRSLVAMAAQASAAPAVCFAAVSLFTPHAPWQRSALAGQLLWIIFIDLPALFLLFWLMPRMTASRMTARFCLAPLFAIVASIAIESASPPARAFFGLLLLAGGAGWLVFAPSEVAESEKLNSLSALHR